MGVPASPFVGRLLREIARCEGGLPDACAEMGVTPQDVDAIANGRTPSAAIVARFYEWLDARVVLEPGERADYDRLMAEATHNEVVASGTLPAGDQSAPQPSPHRTRDLRQIVGVSAIAVVAIVIIVVVAVVLTVAIIRPGSSRPTSDSTPSPASASTSAAPSATTTGSPSPVTQSPAPGASASRTANSAGSPEGLIANYANYKLPCGGGMTIGPGGPPPPQTTLGGDLSTECDGTWYGGDNDELGLLDGQPTYSSCRQDTVVGGQLSSVTQGDVICVQGTGTIALVTLAGSGSTGGISYVTLDVRVWRDSDASVGN